MNMIATHYEMGRDGGLVKVDKTKGAGIGLPVGSVIHWGGNMGWAPTDYAITDAHAATDFTPGGSYSCFDMDNPEKNATLHRVEASNIKDEDDPEVWHSQHFFLTGRTVNAEQVDAMRANHARQATAKDDAAALAAAEGERREAQGRELWARLMPANASHVIVAELICDDSDIQTDYFEEHTEKTVILAPSKHGRCLFAEMRKAAQMIPETAHLGPGCDEWHVLKLAGDGDHRTWAGRLEVDNEDTWATEADALAAMESAIATDEAHRDAIPFEPFCPELPYGAEIKRDSIEHREKYSGGKGYYLEARGSVWRVSKQGAGRYGETEPDAGTLRALAARFDHLEK